MEQSGIEGARTPLLWPSKKSGGLLLAPLQKSRSKGFAPTRSGGVYNTAYEVWQNYKLSSYVIIYERFFCSTSAPCTRPRVSSRRRSRCRRREPWDHRHSDLVVFAMKRDEEDEGGIAFRGWVGGKCICREGEGFGRLGAEAAQAFFSSILSFSKGVVFATFMKGQFSWARNRSGDYNPRCWAVRQNLAVFWRNKLRTSTHQHQNTAKFCGTVQQRWL